MTALSPGQRALLADHLADPASSRYNVVLAMSIDVPVDPQLLEASVLSTVRRHRELTMRFAADTRGSVRREPASSATVWRMVDASSLSAAQLRQRIVGSVARPFVLGSADGPCRFEFFRRRAGDGVLLLVAHHIVTDYLSHGQIMTDVFDAYERLSAGRSLPDPPPPSPDYDAFVTAEWERLRGTDGDRMRSFWKRECDGLSWPTGLPGLTSAAGAGGGATVEAAVAPSAIARIRHLARDLGVSQFSVLLAAYHILLSVHSGAWDLAVVVATTPPARRRFPGVVGYFVRTVLARSAARPEMTVRDALTSTHTRFAVATTNSGVPVAECAAQAGIPTGPVSQFAFGLTQPERLGPVLRLHAAADPGLRIRYGGLDLSNVNVDQQQDQFDLAIEVVDAVRPRAVFRFRTDVYHRDAVETLGAHFVRLLEALPDNLDTACGQMPVATQQEFEQIRGWSRGVRRALPDRRAHDVVREVGRGQPDRVAVSSADRSWTYAELDARVTGVAAALRRRGIRPGDRVGVCLGRSPEQVFALLGTGRAGAVYVPLDAAYPADRLRLMLDDSGVRTVLTTRQIAAAVGLPPAAVLTPEEWPAVPEVDAVPSGPEAYVIYTSGSTGPPKGVAATQRGLLNLVLWQRDFYRILPGDVVLLFASPSFDASVSEMYMALASGATLHIPPIDGILAGRTLEALIAAASVSHVTLPPSVLSTMDPEAVAGLRQIVVAGEECPAALVRRWAPGRTVINAYGPTEATVCAAAGAATGSGPRVPIGTPIANADVWIVGADLCPVPIGVPGELLIGGAGVADGYLGRPDLDAGSFVRDGTRGRLYRTGDLACWRPDGRIEFLGRRDDQVKIRGFRVEPGEIEAVACTHPDVAHAAAVAVGDGADRHLALFVVPTRPVTSAGLRGWIGRRLPRHLVPAVVDLIPAMPLTPTGKIDRRALSTRPVTHTDAAGPAGTAREQALAAMWAEVLGIDRPGVYDDFFSLGGTSLSITRITARIRDVWSIDLPPRVLYADPTIRGVARHLDGVDRAEPPQPAIAPVPRTRPLFAATSGQQRIWFQEQLDPDTVHYNVLTVLRLDGPLRPDLVERALTAVVARHEILRTVLVLSGGTVRQQILPARCCPVTRVDLVGRTPADIDDEVARHVAAHEQQRFDLSAGPLLRATLLRQDAGMHALILAMHHTITDADSTAVLLTEMSAYYAAYLREQEPDLAPPPVQYVDFAEWQQQSFQDGFYRRELDYWRQQLDGIPDRTALPTDHVGSDASGHAGASVSFTLPAGLTARLDAFCGAAAVTRYLALLTAFTVVLGHRTGQDDLVIGVPLNGRTRAETERAMGLFVTVLPLRVTRSNDQTFRTLVHRVRDGVLDAQAHQNTQFEHLVRTLRHRRTTDDNPIFQVVFGMYDPPASAFRLPGVSTTEILPKYSTAKFDICALVIASEDALGGQILYRSALFDAASVEGLVRDWCVLLDDLLADPDRLLAPWAPTLKEVRP